MENFSPAVSVVIPMYNAEKYLSVCLESILIQTFTDFEVIVVDDCSTDSSPAIAESFLERFDGRLKIISLEENTGAPAIPRNVGLDFARGKYVLFVDNDDLIIDTALEEFFNAAETFQADVVYTDCGFNCGLEPVPTEINVAAWDADNIVDAPTLETKDFSERMEDFLKLRYRWPPWAKFLRREFLVDNEIKFPYMKTSEDIPWTFEVVCLAQRFLRVPTPLYVNRQTVTSITRTDRSPEQSIALWINPLLNGVDFLNEFMNRVDFFKENFDVRLQILNLFATIHFNHMAEATKALSPEKVCEIFLREFSTAGSSQPALISYLLTMTNLYRNELMKRVD